MNQTGLATTSTLNISGATIDCDEIIKQLCTAGIVSHVESNKSIRCEMINNKKECWIEPGCTITSTIRSKHDSLKAWNCIKNDQLQCAHICIPGHFSGCVLDWKKDSVCN